MKLNKRKVNKLKVLVLGDLAIDRYYHGQVDRISPEGPIPILSNITVENRLGMAGNVAVNLRTLGAQVTICSALEANGDGLQLILEELNKHDIRLNCFNGKNTKTIYKNRLVANEQMLYRFDQEEVINLEKDEEERILKGLEHDIRNYDAVVLSDYGKGFFSEELVGNIINLCKRNEVPTFIDPDVKKSMDTYLEATVIKLNKKELDTWGISLDELQNELVTDGCDYFIVTLGKDGMVCKHNGSSKLTRSLGLKGSTVDAVGCGDTALAVLTITKTLGYKIKDCMYAANVGAGLVVQKMGTSSITLEELNKTS